MNPYITGQIYRRKNAPHQHVMILGHIWWNVEQTYAYYLVPVDAEGEPNGKDQYEWCANSLEPIPEKAAA